MPPRYQTPKYTCASPDKKAGNLRLRFREEAGERRTKYRLHLQQVLSSTLANIRLHNLHDNDRYLVGRVRLTGNAEGPTVLCGLEQPRSAR